MMYINGTPCHIGTRLPVFDIQEVSRVQADGLELLKCETILGKKVLSSVWIFIGDEAKTIFANWGNVK